LLAVGAVVSVIVGLSSSGIGGAAPSSKRAYPWTFLTVLLVYIVPFSYFALYLKSSVVVIGVMPHWFWLPVDGWWWHRRLSCWVLEALHRVLPVPRW
jgi:hypothetical protein